MCAWTCPTYREKDVQERFRPFGDVYDVYMPRDVKTKRRRGFAFVEMGTIEQANSVIEGLNGADVGGRIIEVMLAKQTRKSPQEMMAMER